MANPVFITNAQKNRTLQKRLQELITSSQELKFLVGFFYFSGFSQIYQSLKETPDAVLKILVGLEVDHYLNGLVEVALSGDSLSHAEIAEQFLGSLGKAVNTDTSDQREIYEQIQFFAKQLEAGRLIIRKTLRPNHAKLYLFKLKENMQAVCDARFITGSSNLTRPGLSGQDEFNIEISDYGTEEAEKYFDELWAEAVELSEDDETRLRMLEVLREESLISEVTPFEAYVLVLKTFFDLQRQHEVPKTVEELLAENGYKNYAYQTEAVQQALTILESYNGVIIADVVGLGKSVIAGMVGASLRKRGMIICPPGLIGDKTTPSGWEMYKQQFHLYDWDVCSCGDLERALEYAKLYNPDIVVVDEVHRFRNQDTRDYELLSEICMNRQVILLTATPFNNSPADIFSLLKLFIVPGKCPLTLSDDLTGRFRDYQGIFRRLNYVRKNHNSKDDDKRRRAEGHCLALFGEVPANIMAEVQKRSRVLARNIRSVIEPVVIRRNRIDLLNDPVYSKEVKELSSVEPPVEQFFELTPEQSEFYDRVLEVYFCDGGQFKGAIYRPFEYEEAPKESLSEKENFELQSQRNLFDFMRRLLVKRFESSFGSFEQSIQNFKTITIKVQQFIQKTGKYILDRQLLEKIYDSMPEVIEAELSAFAEKLEQTEHPKSHKIYVLEEFASKKRFLADIQADIDLFSEIEEELEILNLVSNDPKFDKLKESITEVLSAELGNGDPKRKVIIFTEYVDTVKYLTPLLQAAFPNRVLDVPGSMGVQKSKELLVNFDASVQKGRQMDQFDVLVASDTISEGFNLNRAGVIINYDIPWNPTRVLQRLGRINRIGKKVFQHLYTFNFFPTLKGADVVRSRQIACDKMFLIHNTLGEDVQVFDNDETPEASSLYKRINASPDSGEEETLHTTLRRLYAEIQEKYPAVLDKVSRFAPRVKTAKAAEQNSLTVFTRKGLGLFAQGADGDRAEVAEISMEEALQKIRCAPDEPRLNLSGTFWDQYETIRDYRPAFKKGGQQNSNEEKALINLKALLKGPNARNFKEDVTFIRVLLEDLLDYKTLSEFSLRRLAGIDTVSTGEAAFTKAQKEIRKLKADLGADYLSKLKKRIGSMNQEVIIAVENISENQTGAPA